MNARLEVTTRFYKSAKSRQFDEALKLIRNKILEILEHGPAIITQEVRPYRYSTKKNIWRIRANIRPAPFRLIFEWVNDNGRQILRLLEFLPKKHRLLEPRHTSELDNLSRSIAGPDKTREILRRISELPAAAHETVETEQKPDLDVAHDFAAPAEETAAEPEDVILEPAEASDLLDLYATRSLLIAFASIQGLSGEQTDRLADCEYTEDAQDVLSEVAPDLVDNFLEFLLDQDSPSDLERLYHIRDGDVSVLRGRSLSEFMLSIDEEQRAAIQMPLLDQPFLVEGSAGTGKSVVCLYRLKRMIENRTNETLFDAGEKPSYLFVSFTNSLVTNSEHLFQQLAKDIKLDGVDLTFSTLDLVLDEVADALNGRGVDIPVLDLKPNSPTNPYSTAFWKTVRSSDTPQKEKECLDEVGLDFFTHEVDEVLVDRQVSSLDEYLEKGQKKELRQGRMVPLGEQYRRAIWRAYEKLRENVSKTGAAPFSLRRLAILEGVEKYPDVLPQFNVVIADEIQDMGAIQLKLIVKMAKTPAGLLLARDPGQSIFMRRSSIRSIDPNLRFGPKNSVTLKRSYRMTRQIHDALLPLRAEMAHKSQELDKEATPIFTGPKPRWFVAEANEHFAKVVDDIAQQVSKCQIAFGQFAVLFSTNWQAKEFHLMEKPFPTAMRDARASFNLSEPAVHLITAHSAKGLEFPHVYIPHACRLAALPENQRNRFDLSERVDSKLKLFYVAGTRASESLTIFQEAGEDPGQLALLDSDDWILV